MESLLDEVDSILTPGLSTDTPDWCSNCQSLKQEIKRLQDEQLQNFSKLKQKIISTDLLIKKYKSKCDDYDVQWKRTEEANKRADKNQRQCEILQTQLKAALLDTEPLRKTKITLEAEIRLKNSEIQSLSDKLLAVESARLQYEHLSKASSMDIEKLEAEKKELMATIKSREFGKLTKEAAKEYKHEITNLKRDKAAMVKNEKKLERQLAAAHTKIEHLSGIIKERKFSPKRRVRSTSGNLSSPLKSPTRSPRGFHSLTSPTRSPRGLSPRDHKLSPQGPGRSQTCEEKTESQMKDLVTPEVNEELTSGSSSSSDDTDDDSMSVCSVKWTFSPLMKCLSPLPPSPACFAERKLEREEGEGMEDEEEVSDIADVLEQQLLEDNTPCQVSKDDEIPVKTNENLTCLGQKSSNMHVEDKEKEHGTSNINVLADGPIKTMETKSKVDNVEEEVKSYDNVKDRVKENFSTEENKDRELTLKEKLAYSIEIISPTSVRKRVAHQPNSKSNQSSNIDPVILDNNNKNTSTLKDSLLVIEKDSQGKNTLNGANDNSGKILKKPPVRRSARIYSHRESETEDQVTNTDKYVETMVGQDGKDISQNDARTSDEDKNNTVHSKSDKSEFNRNNTEEFTPSVNESLYECDIDMETASISQDFESIGNDSIVDSNKKVNNNTTSGKVSGHDTVKDCKRSNDSSSGVNETKCESYTSSPSGRKSCDKDEHTETCKDIQTSEKTLVPNPCLQNLENVQKIDEEPSEHIEDKCAKLGTSENSSKKASNKFESHKFINFQKSSLETLAHEIEDYSYVGDYEVLDRNNKESTVFSPRVRGMKKKNVTRKLRRSCKYRDLDSGVEKASNVAANHIHHEVMDVPDKCKVLELKKNNLEDLNVTDEVDNIKPKLENKVPYSDKDVSCKTDSKELSVNVIKKLDGDHKSEKRKIMNSTDQNIKALVDAVTDNAYSEPSKGTIDLWNDDVKNSVGQSVDVDELGNSDVGLEEFNDNVDKITTNRQMSTGFSVNTPTFERVPSTDSAVSFGTSPSRLFNLESSSCGTIVEEEINVDFKTDDSQSKKNSNIDGDSNIIFGVEDLLNCNQEPLPISQKLENAQKETKPFCDTNQNFEKSAFTLTVGKTRNKLMDNSFRPVSDDDDIKPGCSYQYNEPSFLLSRNDITNKPPCEKDSVLSSRIPFISDTLSHDDSSSRSSIQSITSLERASPLSPLSLSPFDFLNPISPLPPSPIREIERVSPLSPEHMTDEQKAEVNVSELDDAKNIEENTPKNDENMKAESKDETIADKIVHVVPELSVKENEKDSCNVKHEKESRNKQPVSGSSDKAKRTNKLESVNKVKNNFEYVKTEGNQQGTPEQDAYLSDISLKLFSIPQMISPVKTPKSCAKIKTQQIKSSRNITEIMVSQKDNEKSHPSVLRGGNDKCIEGGLKKFVSEAPVTAIAVKPHLTRDRTLNDKTNMEMCVRKSSRTAPKKVVPQLGGKSSDSGETNKGCSGDIVDKTLTSEIGSYITSHKSEIVTNDEKCKKFDRLTGDLEKLSEKNKGLTGSGDKETVVSIDEKGDNNKVLEVYTQGHDNLAFKRKARVAHKPNTLKTQKKIQLIDAPALPSVTVGRKRKSLDNNKDTTESKKLKDEPLRKQNSSSPLKTISQETKKKMQGFLKSSETAQSFVAKYSTQPCDDTVRSDLLAACLECLGRVQTETLDVVYRMCENSQYLTITCHLPFTSDVEKKAIELIQYICIELKFDWMAMMREIWNCVFSHNTSASIVGKKAQCRVFIALCSIQGDIEQARAFFYHLVTCGHLNYIPFVVSVVSVWPEVLKKDPSDSPDKVVSQGMTLVMEEIVTKTLQSPVPEDNKKILVILQKLCGWSGIAGNADSILKLLCNRLLSILEEENTDKSGVLELSLALQLLCTRQTWPWFKEQFIMRNGLQTACNKYLAQKILKPVPPDYICEILKLTSQGLYTYSYVVKVKEYQQIIRNWLLPILNHKQENVKVKESCLQTLIELSPLYPECLNFIHSWVSDRKNHVSREVITRLEYLRIQYKQKTGLTCKPFD